MYHTLPQAGSAASSSLPHTKVRTLRNNGSPKDIKKGR
jgi:hypothetical protein